MTFQLGDQVVYDGSLGIHHGTVAAVSPDGAVEVSVPGLPDRLRTDAASLAPRYAEGGFVPAGTTVLTNRTGAPIPIVPPQGPDSSFAPDAGPPAGDDVANPPTVA